MTLREPSNLIELAVRKAIRSVPDPSIPRRLRRLREQAIADRRRERIRAWIIVAGVAGLAFGPAAAVILFGWEPFK